MSTVSLRSIDPNERIHVLDSARGFALLGILLMNIPYFGLPFESAVGLNLRNEYSGPNYYTWWIVSLFFEGSMRGLFSIMFGASMVLLTTRLSNKAHIDSAAEIYYRRMIWMLLFGLIDAFLILWPGDILYSYALCGLFLFPFRSMKPKYLFLVAAILLVLFTVKSTWMDKEPLRLKKEAAIIQKIDTAKTKLTDDQKEVMEKWTGFQEKQKPENKQKETVKELRKTKGSYATLFSYYADINYMLQTTDFYHSGFFDCIIFMLIGIAFFKLNILTGERSKQFYLVLAFVGYIIAFPLAYWKLHMAVTTKFDIIKMLEQTPFATYEIRRFGLTIGHLGLIMFFYKLGWFRFLFNAWGKVGQMAFSNYLLQNITCGILFHGHGFNLFNELERYQLYYVVACVWLLNILFSYVWLHYFRIGPLEWVWRSLTYWKWQPLRKHTIIEAAL